MTYIHSSIETLEARIAPAAVFVNATTATYDDNDGDHVTVKFSKPILNAGNVPNVFNFNGAGYLSNLDLTMAAMPGGTDVTFSVVKVAGGDGLVNVGTIEGSGLDLGAVKLPGDLGTILAGDATLTTTGLKSLAVRSMGVLRGDSGGGNLISFIAGPLGSLTVSGDIHEARVDLSSGVDGKIGSITIGGSLIGGAGSASGRIGATGNIGAIKIGHDVQGGAGSDSGNIFTNGDIASITIGGSLLGGTGAEECGSVAGAKVGAVKIAHNVAGGLGPTSGQITGSVSIGSVSISGSLLGGGGATSGFINSNGSIGAVTIAHDLKGGGGDNSGWVHSQNGGIASLTIGGSLLGGSGVSSGSVLLAQGALGAVKIGHDLAGGSRSGSGFISADSIASLTVGGSLYGGPVSDTGVVFSAHNLGPVKIGQDLIGGSISMGLGDLDDSGAIRSLGRITSVAIRGSIISGIDDSNGGMLTRNATIRAGDDIGSFTVTGSLLGHRTANGDSPVLITARGQQTVAMNATTDLAIGKITIGGRVELAQLLAGVDTTGSITNGDAQIGAVKVAHEWIASSLAAGANPGANGYGMGDTAINAGSANIHSRIASITIGGQVFGTPTNISNTDQYGFVAEQVGSLKIGAHAFAIPANNTPISVGSTTDVDLHIIP